MSQLNSNRILGRPKLAPALRLCFSVCAIMIFLLFPVALRAGLLSKDRLEELKANLLKGSDLSLMTSVTLVIEDAARSGGEAEKSAAINQLLELATAIYSTVDRTVPQPGTVLRTPNLESLGPEGKRIFAGSDPESVQDPELRAAYKKLIRENDELLKRVGVERRKYDAAGYLLRGASDIIKTSRDPNTQLQSVRIQVEKLSIAPWAKENMLRLLIPDYNAQTTPERPPVTPSPYQTPELIGEKPMKQSLLESSQQAQTSERSQVVTVTDQASSSAHEPRRKWPWIVVGAALMIISWGIFKRRS